MELALRLVPFAHICRLDQVRRLVGVGLVKYDWLGLLTLLFYLSHTLVGPSLQVIFQILICALIPSGICQTIVIHVLGHDATPR